MNFINKKYNKIIESLILLVIFIIITFIVKKYFKPFFTIVIILYFSMPLYKRLDNKIKSDKLKSLICVIYVNIILFLILFFMFKFLVSNGKIYEYIYKFNNSYCKNILCKISSLLGRNLNDIDNKIFSILTNNNFNLVFRKGATYTTESLIAYFIGNLICYFILSDRKNIILRLTNIFNQNKLNLIYNKFFKLNNLIKIEIILVISTTCITILGFFILKIENPILLGVICGMLDILPYVGTILVFAPLIIFYIYYNNYIIVIGLISLYILLLIFRQVLEAKFMGNKLNLHPLVIILCSYLGFKFFGVIGVFMSIFYVILIKELILSGCVK